MKIMKALGFGTLIMVVLVLISRHFHWSFDTVEFMAVWTSFICTLLCVYQSRWNYPVGVISTAFLSYSFYSVGLIGSMVLNLYLIPTLVYGWFVWGEDKNTKPVEHVKLKNLIWYALVTLAVYAGAMAIIAYFGGRLPRWDSICLVGSVLAQFLLDRKKIETWYVWAVVNVVSIVLYFHFGLYLIGMQFILFLMNTTYGYVSWRSTMKQNEIRLQKAEGDLKAKSQWDLV